MAKELEGSETKFNLITDYDFAEKINTRLQEENLSDLLIEFDN
ncbi:hypothetical protein [Seonamhaeicola sp. ML3]|nr:hypothetical protein [Seonamhaeicola sp. ML3]